MNYIDLHVHSTISDGTYTPTELIEYAVSKGLTAMALTDHDTINGIKEAQLAANRLKLEGHDITLIPGVEISAAFLNRDIHILGLFVDCCNELLVKTLEGAVRERETRNEKMAVNLRNAGLSITLDELKAEDPQAIITRAHFAKLLYKKGYVSSVKDAFTKYLGDDSPYYVKRNYISPEDAISLIKQASGIPVLAHPLLYHLNEKEIDALVLRLKNAGLEGIEAIYSNNISNEEAYVRSLAKKYDLAITGGSDFHGSVKPDIDLGTGRGNLKIPADLLLPLTQRLKK